MVILILSSCSTAEFDENLKLAFNTMEDVFEECNEVNLTMKKIVDTSFQKAWNPKQMGKIFLSFFPKWQMNNMILMRERVLENK